MNHRVSLKKLGRDPSARRALLRGLATNLVLHNQIETTLPKAKALQRVADKLVTLAKVDSLHNRRQAMSYLFAINRTDTGNAQKLTAVHKLFTEISPRYTERAGGYTRVLRTRKRVGDNAQMALIQFVEKELPKKKSDNRTRRVVRSVDAAASPVAESAVSESVVVDQTKMEASEA